MQTFGVIILLVCCAVGGSLAAEAVLQNAEHPDYPGKCYDEGTQTVVAPLESAETTKSCTKVFCSTNLSLTYTTCGSVLVNDPHCEKIEQDLTKDFPECCHKYKCELEGVVTYH
ncbi:hypothetical protein pipiens_008378 [Culex pipiens pipiens]|uniref:Single domain-containing protein n=1 Tax=Culex pipiens pipiens TaxID=38569 RepID=A0ABD1DI18_CULPP